MENITIGRLIKQHIDEKGISLEELQKKTNVPKKYLLIIINDDYENYPPFPYLKGYLKEISRVLKIDIEEFEKLLSNLEIDKRELIQPKYQPIFSVERTTSSSKVLIIIGVFVLVIIAGIFLFLNRETEKIEDIEKQDIVKKQQNTSINIPEVINKKNKKKQVNIKKIVKKEDNKTGSLISVSKKNIKDNISLVKSKKIDNITGVLNITASELTWIRIIIDNKTKKTYFLKKGDNVSLKAEKFFKLDIGNAGGITINLDNKTLGKPGKRGEVKHIILWVNK